MSARFDLDEMRRQQSGPNPPGATGAAGLPGATGADGAPGQAATVNVGSTQTLSPGFQAFVNNSGNNQAAILNFGIPAGQTGPQGPPGTPGIDYGDVDPNTLFYITYPDLYFQTINPLRVWKKNVPGAGFTRIL